MPAPLLSPPPAGGTSVWHVKGAGETPPTPQPSQPFPGGAHLPSLAHEGLNRAGGLDPAHPTTSQCGAGKCLPPPVPCPGWGGGTQQGPPQPLPLGPFLPFSSFLLLFKYVDLGGSPFLPDPGVLGRHWPGVGGPGGPPLTDWGASVEEVGGHLPLALDLDQPSALQRVALGRQHLVQVRGHLVGGTGW